MIVAFDPGKNIGVAFVGEDGRLERLLILLLEEVAVLPLPEEATLVVGDGTGSLLLQDLLRRRQRPFVVIDERETSLEGRQLYFRDHPPKGLLKFLPAGLWVPPRNLDDYAAYAIALRYLKAKV